MSRYYPPQQSLPPPPAAIIPSYHPSSKSSRPHERDPHHSSSDEGSTYNQYSDVHISEADVEEEDPNASLTSQTLNADGTPKRPMNAFMIFARRRRPQVSAENQSMRTGEISKILSREWNSMNMSEKQFYLDQAKSLKDNFNSKYPDYVYRRRPNNSRKKRRTDGGLGRALDSAVTGDVGEDLVGGSELDASSVEGEDPLLDHADLQYPRIPSESAPTYENHNNFPQSISRASPYTYPSAELSYRPPGSSENRLPYDRNALDASSTIGSPHQQQNPHYSHYPSLQGHQSHSQSPTSYPAEQSWDNGSGMSRVDHGRGAPPGWLASKPDRPLSSMSDIKPSYPTPTPGNTWANAGSPGALGTPGPPATQSPNYAFPTLNSPFYPNQQGGYPSTGSASTSPHTNYSAHSTQMQSASLGGSGRSNAPYDQRGGGGAYATSPSISPLSGYPPGTDRDSQMYQQQLRSTGMSRALPPVQSISTYSQSQSMQSPSPSSAGPHPSSHMGYWSRDKMEGQ